MTKKIFYGWWIVLACFFISFYVSGIVFYGFTAFFEPLVKEFGWSYAQISFAASLRGLELGIFAPVIGFLVDRFGSRKILFYGIITVGLGLISLSLTRSLPMFYSSFLLLAFGAGGCTTVVTMTAVANWFDKNVGKALGVMSCGIGASGLIVPLIIQLINLYNWRTTLIILGFGMWILGLLLSLVIRNKPEKYGYLPDGELVQDPNIHLEKKVNVCGIGFKEVLKQKAFLYLMMVDVIRMTIVFSVITHVMPYLSSVGIPRTTAGIVAGAIPLISIVGRFGFGWLGDVYDKRYLLKMAFSLIGIGMLILCFVQYVYFIPLFLILFSPGLGGSLVLGRTILREYFGKNSFGKILGIILGFASIGGIIGPTLAGWVFDVSRDYRFIWLAFLGLNFVAIGLISKIELPTKNK